jgi:PPP family 3-phenylpropionic acid transporter
VGGDPKPLTAHDPERRATPTHHGPMRHADGMEPATSPDPALDRPASTSVVRPAIVYAVLFGAQGAYYPYISVFFSSAGLDLGTVGALIALFAAVSLVAAPAWGAVADAIGDVRGPVLVAALAAAGAIALLAVATTTLTLAIATALLAAASAGIIPMTDSQAVRVVGRRERFGLVRAPGSAAFIVVAFATGALIAVTGPRGMFLVYGPMTFLIGPATWLLLALPRPPGHPADTRPARGGAATLAGRALSGLSPSTILGVLRTRPYRGLFVALVLTWTSHAAFQNFLSLRVVELGGDATVVAASWSLGPLVEVALMSTFPWFARRIGTERLILVGGLGFATRVAITALAGDPLVIVLASVFGGIGFSFVYVGVVTWVSAHVDRRTQATAQGIFSGTTNGLGAIGGSILGGVIGAAVGLPILFGIAAAGHALGGIIAWLAIGRETRDGPGRSRGAREVAGG